MITVVPDGIWCKECRTLHPTLFWHKKYNDYELDRKERWQKSVKKHFSGVDAEYADNLHIKELLQEDTEGKCVVCGTKTYFKHTTTGNFVCCDECKYADVNSTEV